jgi:1-acyl-sn-glycerol-3-phosphate acyltransferase
MEAGKIGAAILVTIKREEFRGAGFLSHGCNKRNFLYARKRFPVTAARNRMSSFFRQAWRLTALAVLTVALLPLQLVAVAWLPKLARRIPLFYHRAGRRILDLQVGMENAPSGARPLLIVANHVSWLDISLISAALPISFVAKEEVKSWPVFGWLAKLQRSVFVDRTRRQKSVVANSEIAVRLLAGDAIVLFAEGTSSDGKDVLPFRSALIGAATEACARLPAGRIFIQPLSVTYAGEARAVVPWYGDMDLLPHFFRVLRMPRMQAILSWGEPIAYSGQSDRKEVARELEEEVRALKRQAHLQYA